MSGIPHNGAQRASRQTAGLVTLGLPRRNRHRSIIVVGQIMIVTALIFSQLFVDPGQGSAEAATRPVLVSAATLKTKPMSGAAWRGLKAVADQAVGTLTLSDHGRELGRHRPGERAGLCADRRRPATERPVIAALKAAKGTEVGGETLALGRNLPGLVIAADLISLKTARPGVRQRRLQGLASFACSRRSLDGVDRSSTPTRSAPTTGAPMPAPPRVAIAAYLGDTAAAGAGGESLPRLSRDRAPRMRDSSYGDDLTWQCDPDASSRRSTPSGCTKNGVNIDGVIPDDMRRGGSFRWPPSGTGISVGKLAGRDPPGRAPPSRRL